MEENVIKKCFKCNQLLPLCEFYKHKSMPDGHLNKCKTCTKNDVSKREKELRQDSEWLDKERKRNRERYHRLDYKTKWKPTTEIKKETIKKYRQKYPEKYLASKYTEIFLTKIKGVHLHHWSYNQEDWLDIIELNVKDHNLLHRYMVYNPELMKYNTIDGEILDTKEKHISYLNKILKNGN